MKMGNFSAIRLSPSVGSSASLYRHRRGRALVAQLGQAHAVEQLADRRLQLLHRAFQVAAQLLRAPAVVEAAHDADRSLEGADDLADGDVVRTPGQGVSAL